MKNLLQINFRANILKNKFAFLLVPIFILNCSSIHAQNHFSLSAGISEKWSFSKRQLSKLYEPDFIFEGGEAYFVTLGICWKDRGDSNSVWSYITLEKFNSSLLYWDRTNVGSIDAIIIRIEPFAGYSRLGESNFFGKVSLGGINIFKGTGKILPNVYYIDGSKGYLITDLDVKTTIDWAILGFGIGYKISSFASVNLETYLMDFDNVKIVYTPYKHSGIEKEVKTEYGWFPFKLRVTVSF